MNQRRVERKSGRGGELASARPLHRGGEPRWSDWTVGMNIPRRGGKKRRENEEKKKMGVCRTKKPATETRENPPTPKKKKTNKKTQNKPPPHNPERKEPTNQPPPTRIKKKKEQLPHDRKEKTALQKFKKPLVFYRLADSIKKRKLKKRYEKIKLDSGKKPRKKLKVWTNDDSGNKNRVVNQYSVGPWSPKNEEQGGEAIPPKLSRLATRIKG